MMEQEKLHQCQLLHILSEGEREKTAIFSRRKLAKLALFEGNRGVNSSQFYCHLFTADLLVPLWSSTRNTLMLQFGQTLLNRNTELITILLEDKGGGEERERTMALAGKTDKVVRKLERLGENW